MNADGVIPILANGPQTHRMILAKAVAEPDGENRLLGHFAVQVAKEEVVDAEADDPRSRRGDHDAQPERVELADNREAKVGPEHVQRSCARFSTPITPKVRENPAARRKRMNEYETPFSVVMMNVLTRPPGVETSTSSAFRLRAGWHRQHLRSGPPPGELSKNDIPISAFDKADCCMPSMHRPSTPFLRLRSLLRSGADHVSLLISGLRAPRSGPRRSLDRRRLRSSTQALVPHARRGRRRGGPAAAWSPPPLVPRFAAGGAAAPTPTSARAAGSRR